MAAYRVAANSSWNPIQNSWDTPAWSCKAIIEWVRKAPFNSYFTDHLLCARHFLDIRGTTTNRPSIPDSSRGKVNTWFQPGPGKVGHPKDAKPYSSTFSGKSSPSGGPSFYHGKRNFHETLIHVSEISHAL